MKIFNIHSKINPMLIIFQGLFFALIINPLLGKLDAIIVRNLIPKAVVL